MQNQPGSLLRELNTSHFNGRGLQASFNWRGFLSCYGLQSICMGSNLSCYGGSYLAGFLQLEGLPICYGLQPYFPKPERVFKKDHGQRQAIRQGGQGVGMHVLCGCGRMLVGIFL